MVDRYPECRPLRVGVIGNCGRDFECVEHLGEHGYAYQTSAEGRHEVDCLGGDKFSRKNEVAFILTVGIVDDDDHLSAAKRIYRLGDVSQIVTLSILLGPDG